MRVKNYRVREIYRKKMNPSKGETEWENINCNEGQVTVTTVIRLGRTQ